VKNTTTAYIGFAARLAGHWSNGGFIAVVLHPGWNLPAGRQVPAVQQALPVIDQLYGTIHYIDCYSFDISLLRLFSTGDRCSA
jgi:hypothetical protein